MDPEQKQQVGVLHKLFSFTLILHNAPQLYFDFFSDPTTQLGSAIQGPNTDSDGCLFFQHRDRDSCSSFIYFIFQHRLGRGCLLVCLFVCLSVQVCLFLCFFVLYRTATETRVRLLSTIFIYNNNSLQEQIRVSVEWSPWGAWRPTTPRRSS